MIVQREKIPDSFELSEIIRLYCSTVCKSQSRLGKRIGVSLCRSESSGCFVDSNGSKNPPDNPIAMTFLFTPAAAAALKGSAEERPVQARPNCRSNTDAASSSLMNRLQYT